MHRVPAVISARLTAFFVHVSWMASAVAGPMVVPTGLNPGDQFRLAFVTSTTRDALSSSINDYNGFVDTVANSVPSLAALGTTWRAIGSTTLIDARDNTATNPALATGVPIFNLGGQKVADNNADLWDGALHTGTSFHFDELGIVRDVIVWTGTTKTGVHRQYFALGETTFAVVGGQSWRTNADWMVQNGPPAASLHSVYAISDILTFVPEPSSYALAAMSIAALLFARRRK